MKKIWVFIEDQIRNENVRLRLDTDRPISAILEDLIKEFEKDNDEYNIIMVKALADRLAEAFAELMHAKVRKELWGYAADESLENEENHTLRPC